MNMLHKVEEVWKNNSLFMCLNVSGICMVIYLCAWFTLMDMMVGILMNLMGCMVYIRGIWNENFY